VVARIVDILQFTLCETWTYFKYLGIPICSKNLSSSAWNPILDMIKIKFIQWGSQWLNLADRVVLIKAVLLALHVFQFSLLVPANINSSTSQEIRKFLWRGGKSNSKRLPLVNWQIVCAPKRHGGLGILDPTLSNLSLGDKILWRLISDKVDWWKKVLWHKYLSGERFRCLEFPNVTIPGSPIWKLMKATLSLIQSKCTWILGNGNFIQVWMDNIMGNSPLVQDISLSPLVRWCHSHNIKTLADIFIWDQSGS